MKAAYPGEHLRPRPVHRELSGNKVYERLYNRFCREPIDVGPPLLATPLCLMGMERPEVDRFIVDQIDSVPHLEALLLLWRRAPQQCSPEQLAEQLYVTQGHASAIAEDLLRRGLIERERANAVRYFFDSQSAELNELIAAVEATYRRDLIRISGIIHSKASPSVRAFADAFRLRKDKY